MIGRVADLRVTQAQRHGVIVGMPAFLFDEIERHERKGWKVKVDRRWWLAFEWAEGIGPVKLRLVE